MRHCFKVFLLIVLVTLVGIQFIPTKRNQSNKVLKTEFTQTYDVPKEVQRILKISCYDCHSNNTNYPLYNKIQPVAWLLEYHIDEGKAELNFSEFGGYSKRRRKNKLKAIANQIKNEEMPLTSYTLIHSNAKLSEEERIKLVDWITILGDKIQRK